MTAVLCLACSWTHVALQFGFACALSWAWHAVVTASCAGYVSIGFTGIAGKMGPADTYAGWFDGSVAHVIDFSTKQGYSINLPDAQQDAVNVSASISNGVLSVTFSRKLDTAVWMPHALPWQMV